LTHLSVTREDLVRGWGELGLKRGDIAFIHSSLSSFGHVEGGGETVVRSLLEVMGEEGTLVAPIFARFFWEGPDQVWDRDNSPSRMGVISEMVRTWKGVHRSHHAPHPVAAVGKWAEDLADRHNRSDFASDSPFARLLELDALVLLIGVTYNSCTLIHLLEERTEVPYREWVELSGTVVEDGVEAPKSYPFLKRKEGVKNDFLPLGERMEEEGMVRIQSIGQSQIRCFKARDLYECGMRELRKDSLFLVSEDSRERAEDYLPRTGNNQD
jgi:aminoglycoside 3-N-acetyltransferase